MRLLRLELAAFGPFRDAFAIDFASFEADGVYLIAGPTGAGKSTILDAVTFALYGGAPRYEGRPHLRSDLAAPEQPTWVELELAVGGRVLRVRRSPEYERPKQRGSGTTREKAQAQLLELVDGAWEPISTSIAEVGAEIGRILGLTKDEFLQVILLAQGGFAEFLRASSDERKQLLQRLFGTGSMRRLRELLLADAKALDAERGELERTRQDCGSRVLAAAASLERADPAQTGDDEGEPAADADLDGAARAVVRVDEPLLAAAEARLDGHVAERASATDAAAAREREARTARDAAAALVERFERRSAATAALASLQDAAPEIDADRRVLSDADRAAEAASALDRWSRADADLERAERALADAAEALPEGVTGERSAVEAEHELALDAGALATAALELEQQLPALERTAREAAEHASAADAAVAAARAQRAQAPAARAAIADAREAATAIAAGLDAAERALEAALARQAARQQADALAEPLRAARRAAADSAIAQATAAAEAQRLQAARIDGIAGELAESLVDGEPCPVCGAAQHPAPHAPATEPVSADDVAAALAASEAAVAAARDANAALGDLERELAGLDASAGEADADAIAVEVEAAGRAVTTCSEAAAARDRHAAALEQHDLVVQGLDEHILALEEEAAAARASATGAAARLDDARARAATATRGHASADAMRAAAAVRTAALRAWLDAEAERSRAIAEQAAAADAGEVELALHELPDRDATTAMRLDAAVRSGLRERIQAHDRAVASAQAVLAQPDLAGLEGEAPDLAPLETALAEAAERAAASARAEAAAATTRDHAAADLAHARQAIRALADGEEHAATVRALASALHGENELRQDIETYVLATRLGAIIDAANLRLAGMTSGRFALLHDEATAYRRRASGLGIQVLDAHTGVPRTASSLSGGETFLASLALALGLADVVQAESGGVSLETLFVDEGFGSLDADTLEAALATLDELRAGGRSVGVISHVQQMQERIPSRIRVEPVPGGGSRIVVTGSPG